ncbi:MAG: hypothetical protein CMK92_04290 [Pseudomonas sp.]|nr:hypothetical protein [Pseudomonas sp.]
MGFFKTLFSRDKRPENTRQSQQPRKATASPADAVIAASTDEARMIAIKALSEEEQERLLQHSDADIRRLTADVVLKSLAPGNTLPANADEATLTRIIALSQNDDLSQAAIARISSEACLTLAMEHSVAKVRLAAAQRISSEEALKQLQKHAQGKDKAVFRYCKDALAALHDAQAAHAELQARADYIREQAQSQLRLGITPEFTGKVQVLKQRYDALVQDVSDASALNMDDLPALLTQLDDALTAHKEAEAKAEAEKAALAAAFEQQARTLSNIQDAIASLSDDSTAEGVKAILLSEESAWANATAEHSADAKQQKAYDQAMADLTLAAAALAYRDEHALDNLLNRSAVPSEVPAETSVETPAETPNADANTTTTLAEQAQQHLAQLSWPAQADTPSWLLALKKLAGEKPKKTKARKATNTQAPVDDTAARKEATDCLDALDSALEARQVSDATAALKQFNKVSQQLTQKSQHQLNGRLRLLTNQLNELRDWQGFAITPKKAALAEQMEALVSAELAPELLADRIKTLQQEWKALGHSNDQDLWTRFKEAADKAYEPCKAWYAEQAAIKAGRVNKRQALTAELVRYEAEMDWDNADWKTVQNTLNAARDAFKVYSPVEQRDHQRTQKAFNTACDAIYAHVKAEYERNLEQKRALVSAAEAAATNDDTSAAADAIKKIQQDWKSVGITPRGPDQKLWNQLRQHADAVFAKLNDARDARKAEINETVAAAEAIVSDAKTNAATQGLTAIQDARSKLADIELPKGAHGRLVKALSDLEAQINSERDAAEKAEAQGRWDALIELLQSSTTPDETTQLPEGIDPAWFSQETADTDASKLCITMEILADMESPESDKAARMALQVQRLAEGMGKNLSKDEERNALIKQWLTAKADAALTSRFVAALKVVI